MKAIIMLLLLPVAAVGQCPKTRADVKMGTDGYVPPSQPVAKTILELTSLPEPKGAWRTMPRQPIEKEYVLVNAMLIAAGVEADNDFHLVLSDGRRTMIAEIPSPSCLSFHEAFYNLYASARQTVDSLVHRPLWRGVKKIKPIAVTICGVLFFDEPGHNGSGHAANEIEIHPVFMIQ